MHSPTEPIYGTRAYPGLRPKIPQNPEGIRILPPTSKPTLSAVPSAMSSAPSPPEEPPGVWAADHYCTYDPREGCSSRRREVFACLASLKNTIRCVRQTRAQHYHYNQVQIVETQAIHTFSEAIHHFLRLRSACNISLQHYRRSPLSSQIFSTICNAARCKKNQSAARISFMRNCTTLP